MTGAMTSVTSGLQAALRLAAGHADGVVLVPDDRSTIARSFWAIAFSVPAVVCSLLMSWVASGVPAGAGHLMAREIILFAVEWLIFVEITHRLAPLLGQGARWGRFIAVWNWCNVVEGVLVVFGAIPGMFGAPAIVDQVCGLVAVGWALWLEWYAIRLTLGVAPFVAAALVLLDVSLGVMLTSLAVSISP
jgi:hypothetical protein